MGRDEHDGCRIAERLGLALAEHHAKTHLLLRGAFDRAACGAWLSPYTRRSNRLSDVTCEKCAKAGAE